MEDLILVPATDFCTSHHVEIELVNAFNEHGLIEIVHRKEVLFIPEHQLIKLEQILVFYRELDINLEGIETILELLRRMESMQDQITQLENKLQRFL
jgi:DNA-binding transcriptional MerR regulator